jgi:hypothetical protein
LSGNRKEDAARKWMLTGILRCGEVRIEPTMEIKVSATILKYPS